MRAKFAPTTIWAFQAAIAILIAVLIGHIFHLEKSFWAVLAAFFLISRTWGESLKKSFERVGMTILGGCVGTLLFFSIIHFHMLIYLFLLIIIFFMVYFQGYSFLCSTFVVSIFIVFLLGILGTWNTHMLEVRIYETFIGAIAAITTSILILPSTGKLTLDGSYKDFIEKAIDVINLSFDISFNVAKPTSINKIRDQLYMQLQKLRNLYKSSSYEMIFLLGSRRKSGFILNKFSILLHYTTNFLETSCYINEEKFTDEIQQGFTHVKLDVIHNLNNLAILIEGKTSLPSLSMTAVNDQLDTLNSLLIASVQGDVENQAYILDALSFVYYLKKINEVLIDIKSEFEKL